MKTASHSRRYRREELEEMRRAKDRLAYATTGWSSKIEDVEPI